MISTSCVIWSLSHSDNDTHMSRLDELCWSTAPVWTANDMRYWKEMIKISVDTDYYYCVNLIMQRVNLLVSYGRLFNTRYEMNNSRHVMLTMFISYYFNSS